jgi:ribose 5-phosphate isomerase B
MKIALVSDDFYPIHDFVVEWLQSKGHNVMFFGAFASRQTEQSWVIPTHQATRAIQKGECEEGIFFCWTGTGVSIIANKMMSIRAALCTDAQTARGARIWNHANALGSVESIAQPRYC